VLSGAQTACEGKGVQSAECRVHAINRSGLAVALRHARLRQEPYVVPTQCFVWISEQTADLFL
jgi:hypothetical protein